MIRTKKMRISRKSMNGIALIDVMLGFALASMLFIMLYQIYNSVFNSVLFLKNTTDLHTSKMTTFYHLYNDATMLITPTNYGTFFTIAKQLSPEEEKKETEKQTKKLTDKEKKKLEKLFQEYADYIPIIKKDKNGSIHAQWITTNSLLSVNPYKRLSKITYSFVPIPSKNEEKLFKLTRKEESIDVKKNKKSNEDDKKKTEKYYFKINSIN